MSFNIDERLNDDGIEVEYEGSKFIIASAENIKYQRILSKLRYPYRHKFEKDSVDPSILLDIMCKSLSQAILLGWSEVKNDKGQDVEFSIENAYIALKNNGLFRSFVIGIATELENFKAEYIDESIKS